MNYTVTENQVTEFEFGKYCIEASELRLPPGQYPQSLSTNMGNGLAFVFERMVTHSGDVAEYKQIAGSIFLHVLND